MRDPLSNFLIISATQKKKTSLQKKKDYLHRLRTRLPTSGVILQSCVTFST